MSATMMTINLEDGMPTVEQAQRRLTGELGRARGSGAKAVKLIHGYGSTGVGGKLRIGIRQFLGAKKRQNTIKTFAHQIICRIKRMTPDFLPWPWLPYRRASRY